MRRAVMIPHGILEIAAVSELRHAETGATAGSSRSQFFAVLWISGVS